MVDGSFFWAFNGIYGPHDKVDKGCWMSWVVLEMGGLVPGVWGDFNEILHSHERSTGVGASNAMSEFGDFINESALADLPFWGGLASGGRGVVLIQWPLGWTVLLCRLIVRSFFEV